MLAEVDKFLDKLNEKLQNGHVVICHHVREDYIDGSVCKKIYYVIKDMGLAPNHAYSRYPISANFYVKISTGYYIPKNKNSVQYSNIVSYNDKDCFSETEICNCKFVRGNKIPAKILEIIGREYYRRQKALEAEVIEWDDLIYQNIMHFKKSEKARDD